MTIAGQDRRQMDWLLDDFVKATPGVVHSLVVSGDGLRLAASRDVDTGLADSLSAAVSGLVSLARGAASLLDAEPVTQTIVEMTGGYLFATSVSQGSVLVVHTERQCDMGLVGYEMTMLANRVGHVLTPANRTPASPATPARSATPASLATPARSATPAARPPSEPMTPRTATPTAAAGRSSPRDATR